MYVTNKICGMSKLAAIADCGLIYVRSPGKVWEHSMSSLIYFTVSLHICITWECQIILKYNVQSLGIWRIHKATKLIWGKKNSRKPEVSLFPRKWRNPYLSVHQHVGWFICHPIAGLPIIIPLGHVTTHVVHS